MSRYDDLSSELTSAPKRWVVSGVAGFIGSALLERLLSLGQTVVGIDNFSTGHRWNIENVLGVVGAEAAARFSLVEGDICDPEACKRACANADYVLHQAALGSVPRSIDDPVSSHNSNVNGMVEMLVAARDAGVKRFVFASSSSVYGDHPALPKREDAIGRQLSPYAVTKRVDELYARVFQDCYGLETVGLRYFNVFGRRQDPKGAYAAVIPRWILMLLQSETCSIFGDGSNSRDFCYVDNAVQANLLSATADSAASGTVYNVGVGGNTDLNELFTRLRDLIGERVPAVAGASAVHGDPRPGDVAHSQADVTKLITATGYAPTHDIGAGLVETVAWFVARHAG